MVSGLVALRTQPKRHVFTQPPSLGDAGPLRSLCSDPVASRMPPRTRRGAAVWPTPAGRSPPRRRAIPQRYEEVARQSERARRGIYTKKWTNSCHETIRTHQHASSDTSTGIPRRQVIHPRRATKRRACEAGPFRRASRTSFAFGGSRDFRTDSFDHGHLRAPRRYANDGTARG